MTLSDLAEHTDHDPELAEFLEAVTDLSAARHALGPEAFLAQLAEQEGALQALRKYRSDRALITRFEDFVQRRFDLVDEAAEYALAMDEVQVLSLVLDGARSLVIPALKRAIIISSGLLLEEGVPILFGQLLKRLRVLARSENDADLTAWVQGAIANLPDE